MKHCIGCEFCERKVAVVGHNEHGQPVQGMAFVCLNQECTDPVDGNNIPCVIARQRPEICGWQGKHWKKKQEEPKSESKIIELKV